MHSVENKYLKKAIELESHMTNRYSNSILNGNASVILFYFYLYKLTNNDEYYLKATETVNKLLNSLATISFMPENFADGYSGVFWLLHHGSNNFFLNLPEEFIHKNYDDYLLDFSLRNFKNGQFDFFYGGAGPCLYFLENKQRNYHRYYENMIIALENIALADSNGIFWEGNYFERPNNSQCKIDLGLSHGIPSIIYFLTKLYGLNVSNSKTLSLLTKSINWLIAQKRDPTEDGTSFYQAKMLANSEMPRINSRLAWCYGDLGIASVIWQAGLLVGNEEWKQFSINMMLHASKRKNLLQNGINDAGICHGTSGVAMVFNRFYWETKMPVFKETATYWIDETIKMANADGHYKCLDEVNRYSLIEGTCGIGLALLGHISDEEPTWDRCFLLS